MGIEFRWLILPIVVVAFQNSAQAKNGLLEEPAEQTRQWLHETQQLISSLEKSRVFSELQLADVEAKIVELQERALNIENLAPSERLFSSQWLSAQWMVTLKNSTDEKDQPLLLLETLLLSELISGSTGPSYMIGWANSQEAVFKNYVSEIYRKTWGCSDSVALLLQTSEGSAELKVAFFKALSDTSHRLLIEQERALGPKIAEPIDRAFRINYKEFVRNFKKDPQLGAALIRNITDIFNEAIQSEQYKTASRLDHLIELTALSFQATPDAGTPTTLAFQASLNSLVRKLYELNQQARADRKSVTSADGKSTGVRDGPIYKRYSEISGRLSHLTAGTLARLAVLKQDPVAAKKALEIGALDIAALEGLSRSFLADPDIIQSVAHKVASALWLHSLAINAKGRAQPMPLLTEARHIELMREIYQATWDQPLTQDLIKRKMLSLDSRVVRKIDLPHLDHNMAMIRAGGSELVKEVPPTTASKSSEADPLFVYLRMECKRILDQMPQTKLLPPPSLE